MKSAERDRTTCTSARPTARKNPSRAGEQLDGVAGYRSLNCLWPSSWALEVLPGSRLSAGNLSCPS